MLPLNYQYNLKAALGRAAGFLLTVCCVALLYFGDGMGLLPKRRLCGFVNTVYIDGYTKALCELSHIFELAEIKNSI